MKIQDLHLFHGAALTQIVEHNSFKALNRATPKYGHYLVNTDRHLFVKYRTATKSPWQHTLSPDELKAISDAINKYGKVFLCLVCGTTSVCALDATEIAIVVDLTSATSQTILVEVPAGGSCHVSGSKGKLKKTVPHNSFPNKLFA